MLLAHQTNGQTGHSTNPVLSDTALLHPAMPPRVGRWPGLLKNIGQWKMTEVNQPIKANLYWVSVPLSGLEHNKCHSYTGILIFFHKVQHPLCHTLKSVFNHKRLNLFYLLLITNVSQFRMSVGRDMVKTRSTVQSQLILGVCPLIRPWTQQVPLIHWYINFFPQSTASSLSHTEVSI